MTDKNYIEVTEKERLVFEKLELLDSYRDFINETDGILLRFSDSDVRYNTEELQDATHDVVMVMLSMLESKELETFTLLSEVLEDRMIIAYELFDDLLELVEQDEKHQYSPSIFKNKDFDEFVALNSYNENKTKEKLAKDVEEEDLFDLFYSDLLDKMLKEEEAKKEEEAAEEFSPSELQLFSELGISENEVKKFSKMLDDLQEQAKKEEEETKDDDSIGRILSILFK